MNDCTFISQLEKFQIYENYESCYPRTHICKLTLNNHTKKLPLDGGEIWILIQAIAKDKITFKRIKDQYQLEHFSPQHLQSFDEYMDYDWGYFRHSQPPVPEEILSRIFQNV